VGDLDGDDSLEVVTGTRSGWLYAWHTEGKSNGVIEWESYHHDNRNTGNKNAPLEQGDPTRKASRPLDLDYCTELLAEPVTPNDEPLRATGGCTASCTVGGDTESHTRFGAAAFAGLVACAAARRRRTRRA